MTTDVYPGQAEIGGAQPGDWDSEPAGKHGIKMITASPEGDVVVDDDFPDLEDGRAILDVDDQVIERVVVPEWKRAVYVKSLNGAERDAWEQSMLKGRGRNREVNMQNARAKMVVLSVVHPQTRRRLYKDADVAWLTSKNAAALDRIFTVAQRLSGVGDEDLDRMTKNSSGGLSADSISG